MTGKPRRPFAEPPTPDDPPEMKNTRRRITQLETVRDSTTEHRAAVRKLNTRRDRLILTLFADGVDGRTIADAAGMSTTAVYAIRDHPNPGHRWPRAIGRTQPPADNEQEPHAQR